MNPKEHYVKKRILPALAVIGLGLAAALSACTNTSASSDMIGVVVGDGKQGDVSVSEILYPGEMTQERNNKTVNYFPGNSRNYVIENRESGDVDRREPAVAYTEKNVPVNVELTAFFTVNQDTAFVKDKFWSYCLKYQCATTDPNQRNDRSATEGWTKMLDNDMSPAINEAVKQVVKKHDDSIWQTKSDWDKLSAELSDEFSKAMRARTGFTEDVFCGSGDVSTWKGEPGKDGSTFTCGKVRFQISDISAKNASLQDGASETNTKQSQIDQNKAALDAARAKYGTNAEDVLSSLAIIEACTKSASCTVVIDGSGKASVIPKSTN